MTIEEHVATVAREEVRKALEAMTPRGFRLDAKLTAEQLAEAARVSVNTVRRYECGDLNKAQDHVVRSFAEVLGVKPSAYLAAVERKQQLRKGAPMA